MRIMEKNMETEEEPWPALEAQLPIYWVPVLKSLYKFILSITQGPTIWVPGLLGLDVRCLGFRAF